MVRHVVTSAGDLFSELPSWLALVRAANPGPMTLDGTNTWVLRHPGEAEAVVIDPGPLDDAHLATVAAAADARAVIVIATHGHPDHVAGVERFLEICPAARLWRADLEPAGPQAPTWIRTTVQATPGHTADSITVLAQVGGERVIFTGDTILGRGTTVVAHPDGDLGDYLDSLRQLTQWAGVPVLPGHGPALADCAAAANFYLDHRMARLQQVRRARELGAQTPLDVVRHVYADVDQKLWPAAMWSVQAQLAYLDREPDYRESAPASPQLDPP